ncbi:hemerythrin domain-containing protein [Sporosalibacterium faouarense]|uniref:hemerythrin domain-containing protein n=1 Tax=Sporosalibacterium faouarense TaxID=516123 RepID=UPI00192C188E|nr:hemerythrin domain-containing protein [Sporosalibacterium faouarense]
MINLPNLKRQHKEVLEIVKYIEEKVKNNNITDNAMELAKNNNILAGKLKFHLKEEDNNLYPNLISSEDEKLREYSIEYSTEMEGIFDNFMSYKNKYNTKTKILKDESRYIKDTNKIIGNLKKRILKEDVHLYPILEKIQ